MVRGAGIEPAWVSPLAPQTSVSTNFTTRAHSTGVDKTPSAALLPRRQCSHTIKSMLRLSPR